MLLRNVVLMDNELEDRAFLEAKMVTARFYAEHVLPRVHALLPQITQGSQSVLALAEDQF